jgi:predicted nucleotidyltransferase
MEREMTKTIMRIKFGSHLYGTSTPASDTDYKSIFIPDARSILLQRAPEGHSTQRPKMTGEKNVAGDIDEEAFSLQKFLKLASEGQTVAMDVLFAPEWAHIDPPREEWREIERNRHRLLTKKSASFIGYARAQSNKYGIRGSRVAASRAALGLLKAAMEVSSAAAKLEAFWQEVEALVASTEHMSILVDTTPHGQEVRLWEVCNRKMPFTASIKSAHDIMQRLVDEYGKRALMAETNQGVDWKALSHAVRVGEQAIELLTTGHITFPLTNAKHILEIKTGQRPYQSVAEEIEDLLVRVESAAAKSSLPDHPDYRWIDDFVVSVHAKEIATNDHYVW